MLLIAYSSSVGISSGRPLCASIHTLSSTAALLKFPPEVSSALAACFLVGLAFAGVTMWGKVVFMSRLELFQYLKSSSLVTGHLTT